MKNERTEEYLEAIYKRQSKRAPITTSCLAEDLKVSRPAVTDMLRHLDKEGFIEYKPSKGATLTVSGTKKALSIVRRHRLWERFLTDIFGMKWDKVHEEACQLEHVTSPAVENRLADILGDIDTCPHGHSIPDKSGRIKDEKITTLPKLHTGEKVRVIAIAREDPRILKAVEELGLRPGAILKVTKKERGGPFEVEVDRKKFWLMDDIAASLLVKPAAGEVPTGVMGEMPLSKLTPGQSGIIKSYTGKRGMLGRCLSLGFTPGSLVKMLENFNRGPVLVKIHDTEVALGQGLAEKIVVTAPQETC